MRIALLYPTHLFFSDHICQVTWYIGEPRNVTNIPRSTQKTMFIPWKLCNYNKDIYYFKILCPIHFKYVIWKS